MIVHFGRALVAMTLVSLPLFAQPVTTTVPKPAPVKELSVSPAVSDELAALVGKISLPAKTKMLFVGDSITSPTAAYPYRYPEILGHFLKKKFGETVEVVNAGVGGDNVPAALKRVETDVIAKKPTMVFINLGVNDSKLAAPDHTRNAVPPAQFEADYRQLIAQIKEKTGASVVVIGTIACVDEWTSKAALGGATKKNYFGKPDELKKFNAIAQSIGKDLKCDYVDLYDAFMSQPDLKALFKGSDGVHCREKGQEVIALQIMRYLQRKYPAK